jgi:hypothetical protein
MKIKYILAGSFALLSLFAKAQKTDSVFKKQVVKPNEIEFLYNHYIQDGSNSAVTGGIGTEKLTVIAPQLNITHTYKNADKLNVKMGVDIISSASTDNIDYIKSSASVKDARTHLDAIYTYQFKDNVSLSGGSGFSIESDYFSVPVNVGLAITERNGLRTYGIDLQSYFDDLRWGRLNAPASFMPEKLIYPGELRNKQWYDGYKRNSYNLRLSFTQVINKRNLIGIYVGTSYQKGLLSTPFHRVYFSDNSLRVENLPNTRWKQSLEIKLNTFVGGRTIVKNTLDLYSDSFSVRGLGFETEAAVKVTPQVVIAPSIRVYFQEGSEYFKPYLEHTISEEFYTSDYDLSTFTTQKAGLAFRFSPTNDEKKLRQIEVSYASFIRSNGLSAHIISCVFKGIGKTRQ